MTGQAESSGMRDSLSINKEHVGLLSDLFRDLYEQGAFSEPEKPGTYLFDTAFTIVTVSAISLFTASQTEAETKAVSPSYAASIPHRYRGLKPGSSMSLICVDRSRCNDAA